ncbi:LLM class flavin-dependent oxidoreductase [Micromonospora haikouensis]|uniref:LLM class flavin-dependent oxidoreductase n=1 Tax=Micromonospora haikouensis TaxID=686309 RepID=UPI00159F17A5|nr:LLM class flavin-dependent oxidoreductase [Micromonospora haikouensis]
MTSDPPAEPASTPAPPWFFAISRRNHDPAHTWSALDATVRLADRYGFTGILAHTGNDTLVDPWFVGQHTLTVSDRLLPLVAVNPVYHHPFAVAQLAASLTYRHRRPIFLNFVAGTSTPDRLALGDHTDHDRRYQRLREHAEIVLRLTGDPAPVTVDGEFYQLRGARLRLPVGPRWRPVPFVAGHSPAARETAQALGATHVGMISPRVPPESAATSPDRSPRVDDRTGVYAGLIVRADDRRAWRVARERYPHDPGLEEAGATALRYTDALWRHEAFRSADDVRAVPGHFWTGPMRSLRADCPYLVGGVDTLAPVLAAELAGGVRAFILDLAPTETDFRWARELLRRATALAAPAGDPGPPPTHGSSGR